MITLTDGRTATGNFVALDRLGNIILENAMEYRKVAYIAPPNEMEEENNKTEVVNGKNLQNQRVYEWNTARSLTQAVVPGGKLAKVQIAKREWEARIGNIST